MRTLISFGFFFLLPFFAKAQEFTLVQINAKWNIKNNIELNIDKEEIMKYFKLKPSKEIGIIKEFIKNSILDGKIKNDKESAKLLMIEKGKSLGLKRNSVE